MLSADVGSAQVVKIHSITWASRTVANKSQQQIAHASCAIVVDIGPD